MGSSSSIPAEFQDGKRWRDIYEADCIPKIEAGVMKESECFEYLRTRIGSLDDLCSETMLNIDSKSDDKEDNKQDEKLDNRRRSRKNSLVPAYIDFIQVNFNICFILYIY
jgi:hypothetical protein